MTQQQDHIFGWHVVAFLDVLGQRERLRQITTLPKDTEELRTIAPLLQETAGYVLQLRKFFLKFFEGASRSTGLLDDLPEGLRVALEDAKRQTSFRGFSDSFLFSVALREQLPVIAVHATLLAASAAMCWSLSQCKPLRGGLDVGLAVNITEGEIYGPALERAYCLESAVAQWPRIVVGKELTKYLRAAQMDDSYPFGLLGKKVGALTSSWIVPSSDGRSTVDYLTAMYESSDDAFWIKVVKDAYAFILDQERHWPTQGNQKLSSRYAEVRAYFESRDPLWHFMTGPQQES